MSRKAVLITGGARRLGGALSLYFAKQGYDIVLHHHSSKKDALHVQKQITAMGRKCELLVFDLSETKKIPIFMKKIRKAMPHCDALINNASVFEPAHFMETDEALFDHQTTINYKAPFFMTQAFAREFKTGCVINLVDSDIIQTHGSHFAYLLSKKVLADFTVMAARELGPKIRVNAVGPGPLLLSSGDKKFIKKLRKRLPLRKEAELEDVSRTVHFLCEEPSITGQIIYVDGGKHVL